MDGMEGVLTTNCSSCSDVVSLDEMSRLRDLSCPSCRKPIVEIPKLTDPALVVVRGDGELQISATIDLSEEVSFGPHFFSPPNLSPPVSDNLSYPCPRCDANCLEIAVPLCLVHIT